MDWDIIVNQELAALNEAYSRARIETPEYRLRRRMLLRSALRRQGASIHTLRRPAGVPAPTAAAVMRAMPMRRATSSRKRRAGSAMPWIVGGLVLASAIAAACLFLFPPP
ncbi:MAG TPA: hypothetical protein VN813_17245 [Luteibacter sp.]|nr:hypothetical protein [Luteibacter sp.]